MEQLVEMDGAAYFLGWRVGSHGVDLAAQFAIGPTNTSPFALDLSNGLLLALRR